MRSQNGTSILVTFICKNTVWYFVNTIHTHHFSEILPQGNWLYITQNLWIEKPLKRSNYFL